MTFQCMCLDISRPLLKAYCPQYTESDWYEWWQQQGYFSPEYITQNEAEGQDRREKFVICLPPPNVTGSLHLGHALGNSIQDAIVRW